MKMIWRLYAWASIVAGMITGILRDDWPLYDLVSFMSWHLVPFSNDPGFIADLIVFPAALVAWMVPASTWCSTRATKGAISRDGAARSRACA